MNHVGTVITLLENIRLVNKKRLDECLEDKLHTDSEYIALYQAYWGCDLQIENVLEFLKVLHKMFIQENVLADIVNMHTELKRRIDDKWYVEDSDFGLYVKGILESYGLIDKENINE